MTYLSFFHQRMIESVCKLLFCEDIHPGIKTIALKLMAILSTVSSWIYHIDSNFYFIFKSSKNINSNKFIESFVSYHQVFDALIDLFHCENSNQKKDELLILLLLVIFLNFRKPNVGFISNYCSINCSIYFKSDQSLCHKTFNIGQWSHSQCECSDNFK